MCEPEVFLQLFVSVNVETMFTFSINLGSAWPRRTEFNGSAYAWMGNVIMPMNIWHQVSRRLKLEDKKRCQVPLLEDRRSGS